MNSKVDTFANRLNKAMEIRNLKQADLVDMTFVSKQQMSQYVNGKFEAKQIALYQLASALNVSEAWLMGYDVPMERLSTPKQSDVQQDYLPVITRKIPIIGNVHCGVPEYAEEDYLDIVDSDIRADFALRAVGDSMTGAGIDEGDLVFVRKQSTINSGELAVVLLKDEAAVKRVYKYDSYISLNAENPAYAPILIRENEEPEVYILGKVVAHTHFYKERK